MFFPVGVRIDTICKSFLIGACISLIISTHINHIYRITVSDHVHIPHTFCKNATLCVSCFLLNLLVRTNILEGFYMLPGASLGSKASKHSFSKRQQVVIFLSDSCLLKLPAASMHLQLDYLLR